jgi:DNA polymerase III subunit epsilon
MTEKIIYLDTETTGLDYKLCDIWQIGAIVEIDGDIVDRQNFLMAPKKNARIESGALKLQNMTKSDLYALPDRVKRFKLLKKILNNYVSPYDLNDKFLIIGYNVQFDIQFLRQFWLSFGDKYFNSYFLVPAIDVMGLAGLYSVKYGIPFANFKLQTVCDFFGVKLTAHDAMSDIEATMILYKILLQTIRNRLTRHPVNKELFDLAQS